MFKCKLIITFCLMVFCVLRSDALVGKNLVLYLPFDEGKGKEVKDLSGNGNNGVINGDIKWIDGKDSKALEFGGDKNQYVEIPDSPSLRFGKDPFTYMAWVKSYKLKTTESQAIMSKRVPEAGNGKPTATLFIEKQKDCLSSELRDNALANFVFIAENAVLKENTWHHIAWVKDNTELRYYVDGNLMQKTNHDRKGDINGTQSLYIGVHRYGTTWNSPFNGAIDSAAIFRDALDDSDIKQFMGGVITLVQPLGKLTAAWGEIKR